MAAKITKEKILEINELYLKLKTYAAVARELEISPGTVKKYVQPNYVAKNELIPQTLSIGRINEIEDFIMPILDDPNLLVLTKEEIEDMKKFWESIGI